MFEIIDVLKIKKGEKYFVKNYNCIVGELTFVDYCEVAGSTFVTFCSSQNTNVWLNKISVYIYRYVSDEEYRIKLKEKYNQTCLNIILKRLIDESFSW